LSIGSGLLPDASGRLVDTAFLEVQHLDRLRFRVDQPVLAHAVLSYRSRLSMRSRRLDSGDTSALDRRAHDAVADDVEMLLAQTAHPAARRDWTNTMSTEPRQFCPNGAVPPKGQAIK